MINGLQPKTPEQASLKVRALQLNNDIFQARLSLFAQPPDSVSTPFMVVLVVWLAFLFTTFAMSSKPNITLAVVLCVCVVSASGALYLIMELGLPFSGVMQVSSNSLRATLPPL